MNIDQNSGEERQMSSDLKVADVVTTTVYLWDVIRRVANSVGDSRTRSNLLAAADRMEQQAKELEEALVDVDRVNWLERQSSVTLEKRGDQWLLDVGPEQPTAREAIDAKRNKR